MRPSAHLRSDMPGPKHAWNYWWGDRAGVKQQGVIQYTLSPFQSKAAPRMIRTYMFNAYRRVSAEALYVLIPFGTGYAIYSWAKRHHEWQNSKAGQLALGENEH